MPHSATSLPVTFFGRHCHFSAKALQALLQAGHRIDLVVVPGSAPGCRVVFDRSRGPRLSLSAPAPPPTVAALAWSAGTSLVEVDRGELESLPRRFRSLSDGVGVAACFPWKLPPVVLDRPPMGMLNVHPSLLPAHRGSDPVFWTVRAGERVSGATVHRMTEELDAGPSLAQASFDVALRSRASDIESRAVDVGIRLLIDVLATLSANGDFHLPPAATSRSPLEPRPVENDLRLDTSWSAERAFRFIYGAGPEYGPLTIDLPSGKELRVSDSVEFEPARMLDCETAKADGHLRVQFADGVVTVVPCER